MEADWVTDSAPSVSIGKGSDITVCTAFGGPTATLGAGVAVGERSQRVPYASSVAMAALLAQAGQPFVFEHDLANQLRWDIQGASAMEVLRGCHFARASTWYALLSPDGVVGHYDRAKWAVGSAPTPAAPPVCSEGAREEDDAQDPHTNDGILSPHQHGGTRTGSGAGGITETVALHWQALVGQSAEVAMKSRPPRHVATPDCSLEEVLGYWTGASSPPVPLGVPVPLVYLRGCMPELQAMAVIRGSVFEKLLATMAFGAEPFALTLYVSRAGLQTNLHVDEHSGFLAQISGQKRVVLFGRSASRPLRCAAWGDTAAPVNRRSWFDSGVPDEPGWAGRAPFVGLGAREVEVGPGEALYIPKRWFHDVLSRGPCDALGAVLRCRG